MVNVVTALAKGKTQFMPNMLVAGGGSSGSLDELAATLMQFLNAKKEGSS